MTRTLRLPRRQPGQCRPRLERLETRLALSTATVAAVIDSTSVAVAISTASTNATLTTPLGSYLTPIATDPASGADLTQGPSAVTVTFDRPLLSFSVISRDVIIETQQGGSWSDLFSLNNSPTESLDATGTQLTLTLAQPLAAGNYRIVLPQSSGLQGTDGSTVANLGQDQVLSTFTVESPGISLADATVLAAPVGATVGASGALDLQNDPGAVDLYTFTLPAGHQWRLGAEVLAEQIGSPLRSTLALFDAQGRLISEANLGLPTAPNDPYLFAGLAPGTYYLGVSSFSDVPGTASGYNPATGQAAVNASPQPGGAYQLNILADPADTPTQLTGFSLQYADPLDPHPTGLTLNFSGPLDPSTLLGNPCPGVLLVNQDGQAFPITAVSQNEAAGQYQFLINQDLPAGAYSVVVPSATAGGLTDLAGATPVAPGESAGVLATFNVSGTADPSANDLGPLYADVLSGVSRTAVVAPGAAVSYRFVVLSQGLYDLSTQSVGGSLTVTATGPGLAISNVSDPSGQAGSNDVELKPGVYDVQFRNGGGSPVSLVWTVTERTQWDSLLSNGLGQAPALNLMLTASTASTTSSPTVSATSSVSSTQAATPGGAPVQAGIGSAPVLGSIAGVAPGGLALTLGNLAVGRPSTQPDHVAVVGPASGAGSASPALASAAPGLPLGVGYSVSPAARPSPANPGLDEPSTDPAPVNGALAEAAEPPRPNETALAAADALTDAGAAAVQWLTLAPQETTGAEFNAPASEAAPIALVHDDAPTEPAGTDRVERAQIGSPLVIGLAAVMSFRTNMPLLRWLKRNRSATESRRGSSIRPAVRGPHVRL